MIKPKTAEEIATLREGGSRHAKILKELTAHCKPGQAVTELDQIATELITDEDSAAFYNYQPKGASRPYPSHICVSINDEIVHGIPTESDYILQDGDVVTVDMGLNHNGLITDAACTIVVGDSTEIKDKLLTTCKKALMAGITAAEPGAHVGDISAAIEAAVNGRFSIFQQLVGHGVGYSVHEDPVVPNIGRPGTGPQLPKGTVIAIEPMIGTGGKGISADDDGYTYRTADASLSAHFEHTVAVTAEGPVILTTEE